MAQRLKVLISAYACEPGKGSEPEIGWQWAQQMARFHDVTVLTRANNAPAIEAAMLGRGGPRFVYHDLAAGWLHCKRWLGWHSAYYRLWQSTAQRVAAKLCAEQPFDLLHHLTYTGVRYPVAVEGHGVPWVWGPVGGIESTPGSFIPWKRPRVALAEVLRNVDTSRVVKAGTLVRRAKGAGRVIAATRETKAAFSQMGVDAELMSFLGISPTDVALPPRQSEGPLRLVFVGRIVWWKGVEFALRALAISGTDATLTFIGDGPFLPTARALAAQLGLGARVEFRGSIPRSAVLASRGEFDAMLFPSLHDSGGFALVEGMAAGLPVICLDAGGPGVLVAEGCGVRVRFSAGMIPEIAAAIFAYSNDRARFRADGERARLHISANYLWETLGEQMDRIYRKVIR